MEERARLCRQIDSQAKKTKQPKDRAYRKKMTTVEMLRYEPGDTYLMPHHIITINKKNVGLLLTWTQRFSQLPTVSSSCGSW